MNFQLRHQPSGFHIGFNDGEIFGNVSEHLHIHIIPRYKDQDAKTRCTLGHYERLRFYNWF